MEGVIQGGWDWVAAAWGISLAVLVTYTVLLQVRIKSTRDREDRR